jgi:hypothetical protein
MVMVVLVILLSGSERILSLNSHVYGRAAGENGEIAGSRVPLVPGDIVIGKRPSIEEN